MNKFNRDLLVLTKEETNPKALQHEVEQLHELLFFIEQTNKVICSHELINANKRKIYHDEKRLRSAFSRIEMKPFVFLSNLN